MDKRNLYCPPRDRLSLNSCKKDTRMSKLSVQEEQCNLRLILARHFEGSQELSWPRNATFRILARHFHRERRKCLTKISLCQNAESGVSGPRKFLATFKMSRQNKPLSCHRIDPPPYGFLKLPQASYLIDNMKENPEYEGETNLESMLLSL